MTDPELDQGLLASGLPMSVYTSLCPPNREHQVILSFTASLFLGFHPICLLLIQNTCLLHLGVGDKTKTKWRTQETA